MLWCGTFQDFLYAEPHMYEHLTGLPAALDWVDYSGLSSWLLRWHPPMFSTHPSGRPTSVASVAFSPACPHRQELPRAQPSTTSSAHSVRVRKSCPLFYHLVNRPAYVSTHTWIPSLNTKPPPDIFTPMCYRNPKLTPNKSEMVTSLLQSPPPLHWDLCLWNWGSTSPSSLLSPVSAACEFMHMV